MEASLLAPWGGHPAQQIAAIAAQFGSLRLTVSPPDGDAKVGGEPAACWPAASQVPDGP